MSAAPPFPVQGAINAVLDGEPLTRLAQVFERIAEPLQVFHGLLLNSELNSDVVDHFELRERQQMEQPVHVLALFDKIEIGGRTSFQPVDHQIFEGRAGGPPVRDHDLPESCDDIRIGHQDLLAFARAVTRYVTGAILAASRWLQRKAWVRRAAACLRPSDTTEASA